jgi:integrase
MPLNNPGVVRLTAAQLSAIRPTGEQFDVVDPAVPGLILRVGPSGSKRWLFRFRWKRARPRIALGEFPAVGLSEARDRALAHRKELSHGIDPRRSSRAAIKPERSVARARPIEQHQHAPDASNTSAAATTPRDRISIPKPDDHDKQSFHFLAYEYVEHFVKISRDVPQEVVRILNKDALPYWGERDARTITSREVVERLDEIVTRGAPVMANRTAGIFSQMFSFGVHRSIIVNSPVNLLFRPGGKEKSCDRVLSEVELHRYLQGLSAVCTTVVRYHTLMVLLLLLVRLGSLAKAKWHEFDFAKKEWSIPAEHDKERRSHIVPLTDWAIEHLLKKLSKDSIYVLPKQRKTACDQPCNGQIISRSVNRLQARFRAIGIKPFTPHDLRRTGRTCMAMLGIDEKIAERVLNHSEGEIVKTYDLWQYVPQKRAALENLEAYYRCLLRDSPSPNAKELICRWNSTRCSFEAAGGAKVLAQGLTRSRKLT